jgi:ferritin-like metal-binding protein YciE
MSDRLESMHDLLVTELRDLYSVEKQLTRALPKMAKAANSEKLKEAIAEHLEVTKAQVERLDQIFEEMEVSSRGPKCVAMEGLIEEGAELIEKKKKSDPAVFDAALIAAAQRVEHYEISGYGSARTFAQHLGLDSVVALLQETLDEEKQTDVSLTELAETEINIEATEEVEA